VNRVRLIVRTASATGRPCDTFQLRIIDLKELSGKDFGDLKAADPLACRIGAAKAEGLAPRPVVELDSLESVVL
jgi:endonuclease G